MTNEIATHAMLSDAELLREVKRLTTVERQVTAQLIARLGELDARRLYLGEGCSSLFTYCTQVLHLSEHAAYLRIEAARAAQKWPILLGLLVEGALHLTAIGLIAPHLTADNHERVLASARHKSKREVEVIVAGLRPQPAAPSSIRKLPQPKPAPEIDLAWRVPDTVPPGTAADAAIAQPVCATRTTIEIKPLAPEHYKVQCTVSRETHEKLREAQDLMRHVIPDGDPAAIFERALTLLLADLRRTKHAAVARPRMTLPPGGSHGRYIPAGVKRAVWERDGGQCAFVGTTGRCTERGFLEYHHLVPFSEGGASRVDNLELRCRSHNAFEAERWFGVCGEDVVRDARAGFASP
jgi:hypothetical protein